MLVVTLVSWILLCSSISCQACDNGWFGSACQYKCNCASWANCDSDGQCPNNKCGNGWFGAACQFADLASGRYTQAPALTDNNDDTCVPSWVKDSVTVTLNNAYTFSWLRVRVNNTRSFYNLTVTFNGGTSSCSNQRTAEVDDKTLDIHCSLSEKVKSVNLTGDGVQYMCSLYISGGRNVALKQATTQTSNYYNYKSYLAVDGNTDTYFYTGSCTHTLNIPIPSIWTVTFSKPERVNRFVLFNREDLKVRLQYFILTAYHKNGSAVFSYRDSDTTAQLMYTVISDLNIVSIVTIQVTQYENTVTLCEVEIYGDSDCPAGMFGRECDYTCNCVGGEACFVSTGGCPSGCAVGFMGENCSIVCRNNTWGPGCMKSCSDKCATPTLASQPSCNNVNGSCTNGCQSGYKGEQCTDECDSDKYGQNCVYTCSSNCKSSIPRSCDKVDGSCLLGCTEGYTENNCTLPCPPGWYGQNCSNNCSYCVASNITGESACDNVKGICKYGCVSGAIGSGCTANPGGNTGTPGGGGDDNSVIIGAVVGSVLGVIVVVAVILAIIFIRRRQKRIKSDTSPERLMEYSTDSSINQNPAVTKPVPASRKEASTENITNGVYYNSLSSLKSTVVSLDELEDYMSSKNRDFFKEQFDTIPANEQATMTAGLSAENKPKNRYKNVCAYDHSRVHLIPNTGKRQGDYINASYVEGYKPDERFIASQGPTKIILEDFVRMLWEQEVEKMVMLTNLVEDGKLKCERYWPEDDEMKVGEIVIKLATTKIYADYTIRTLQLKKEGRIQDLTHYHFTSWPDKDIPTAPWGLVDFEQRVASHATSKPIVVHCSAGIGRTGTFIALRNVMRQAEETGKMDFFKTVSQLRHERFNMVQTVEQYIFLHKAALVAMLCIGTTVTSDDVQNTINKLQVKTSSGETKMEKEFKAICSACVEKEEAKKSDENPYNVYENSQNILNRKKNRLSNILANEMYRPMLVSDGGDSGNYINAVLVPSFTKQNQQILTQLPLPDTITDFWHLVIQYKVALVVAFQVDLKTDDQTIGNYLPSKDNETFTFSVYKIGTEQVSTSKLWRQQKLTVTMDADKMSKQVANKTLDKEHQVNHVTCTTTDLDPKSMLAIMEHVRSLKPVGADRRILYMCRNGADFSGLLCVLHLLLDRMDNDGCLTVPLVVGAIKAIRPQVIPTQEQYKHLYDVLQLYSQTTNEYSNFGSSNS